VDGVDLELTIWENENPEAEYDRYEVTLENTDEMERITFTNTDEITAVIKHLKEARTFIKKKTKKR
jgi:hypothetical protein